MSTNLFRRPTAPHLAAKRDGSAGAADEPNHPQMGGLTMSRRRVSIRVAAHIDIRICRQAARSILRRRAAPLSISGIRAGRCSPCPCRRHRLRRFRAIERAQSRADAATLFRRRRRTRSVYSHDRGSIACDPRRRGPSSNEPGREPATGAGPDTRCLPSSNATAVRPRRPRAGVLQCVLSRR